MSSPDAGRASAPASLAAFRWSAALFGVLLALAIPAFWPRYLSRAPSSVDAYTHVHAGLSLAWCLLLVVQPWLVARAHRAWHRRLGRVAWGLGPAMVVASILLASQRFRAMDDATFATEHDALYLPLSAAVMFGWPLALALWYRRQPLLHGRFMIATGLVMVDPVVGRVMGFYLPPFSEPLAYQAVTFSLELLVLAWMAWRPPLSAPMRRTYLSGVAIFPIVHAGWFTFAQGPAWTSFATWFRSLPLTP